MKFSKPIALYIFLAFSISWITFVTLALNHHQIIFLFPDDAEHARTQDLWHSFGGLGPIIAAVIVILIFYGRIGWRQFLSGYSIQKLNAKGWLLTFSPIIIFALAIVSRYVIMREWMDLPEFFHRNKLNQPLNLFAWCLPLLFYGFGEEGGWRGFLLPALQSKHAAFKATIILTVIWASWHIPTFYYRYNLHGVDLIGFLLGVFAGAIWLTFLFNYTKGSILAVSIWHLTFNLVSMIGKDDALLSAIMSTAVMLLGAFVLIRYKAMNLSPLEKTSFYGIPEKRVYISPERNTIST